MMETCVKDLSVPVSVIVAESGRRGRRRQVARRLRIAGTVLTVAAIAFAGANAGLPLISAGPRTGTNVGPADRTRPLSAPPATPTAPTTPAVPSRSPDPDLSSSPDPSAAGDRWQQFPLPAAPQLGSAAASRTGSATGSPVDFTTYSVLKDLEKLMPTYRNRFTQGAVFRTDRPGEGSTVHLDYTDEAGPVALELSLHHSKVAFPAGGASPDPDLAPFRCGTNSGTSDNDEQGCLSGYRPDGSWEMVAVNDAQVPGLFGYRVAIWRPDGTILDFTEYSGTVSSKGDPIRSGRYRPPLDLTFWRSVTESPIWTPYLHG